MNVHRVIKSNAEFFVAKAEAGSTWRSNAISARGDDVDAAKGSNWVPRYLVDNELPKILEPTTCSS